MPGFSVGIPPCGARRDLDRSLRAPGPSCRQRLPNSTAIVHGLMYRYWPKTASRSSAVPSRPRCRLRGAPSGSRAPTALATPDRRLHQPDHRRNLPVHLPYSASRTAGTAPRQPAAAECAGHRSGGADRLQPAADAVHHPTAGSPAPCRARPRPDDLSAAVAGARRPAATSSACWPAISIAWVHACRH